MGENYLPSPGLIISTKWSWHTTEICMSKSPALLVRSRHIPPVYEQHRTRHREIWERAQAEVTSRRHINKEMSDNWGEKKTSLQNILARTRRVVSALNRRRSTSARRSGNSRILR